MIIRKLNISRIAEIFLGICFILSGALKLYDPSKSVYLMDKVLGINSDLSIFLIASICIAELMLAFILLFRFYPEKGILASIACFSFFLLFSIYLFYKGSDLDCGCFGSVSLLSSGKELIMRNAILLGLSVMVFVIKKKSVINERH